MTGMVRFSLVFLFALALPLAAQDTTRIPTGVVLGTRYTVLKRPTVAVRPIAGGSDLVEAANHVTAIIKRDLDYSDRFEMVETMQSVASGPVQYELWNSLNVVFLVAGEMHAAGDGYRFNVELHDVPFTKVKEARSFDIPRVTSPGFRMGVHAVADEIVRWITGQPGMAASRIAYTRWAGNSYELHLVDSDGENPQRIFSAPGGLYSPAFSPDGRRIAYGARRSDRGHVELRERDLATGQERVISDRPLMSYTPSYSPDGKRIAYSIALGNGNEIFDYDLEKRCCQRRLTQGSRSDLSPSYSPDGSRIAFHSDRAGQNHIYVMNADGGEPSMITPYAFGQSASFVAPDWSPTGDRIAFHGQSRGGFQIMIVEVGRSEVKQVTEAGNNEDPNWAPDGRHIVYSRVGRAGPGLYVIDVQTGRTRSLISGRGVQMPEWSGILASPTVARAGN